jgi:CBS domain-containing protein
MKVRDIMAAHPVALRPDDTIREATAKLAASGVGGAPVVDEVGRLLGVLSEVDVLEALKTEHRTLRMLMPPEIAFGIDFVEIVKERDALEAFRETGDTPVSEVMTRDVVTVEPEESVERVIPLMVKQRVHRIPVVEEGKLVGVVTRGDVLRGFFREVMGEGG